MIQSGLHDRPRAVVSRDNGATFTGQMRVALKPEYAMGVSNSVVLADGSSWRCSACFAIMSHRSMSIADRRAL